LTSGLGRCGHGSSVLGDLGSLVARESSGRCDAGQLDEELLVAKDLLLTTGFVVQLVGRGSGSSSR
jgi:hypothetical protein